MIKRVRQQASGLARLLPAITGPEAPRSIAEPEQHLDMAQYSARVQQFLHGRSDSTPSVSAAAR